MMPWSQLTDWLEICIYIWKAKFTPSSGMSLPPEIVFDSRDVIFGPIDPVSSPATYPVRLDRQLSFLASTRHQFG